MSAPKKSPAKRAAYVLIMRTVDANRQSRGGFQYPPVGQMVEATDWSPRAECGNGLHGWLWGEGDGSLGEFGGGHQVLVLRARADETVQIGADKVKCRRGRVVYCGSAAGAVQVLHKHLPKDKQGKWRPICGQASAGYLGQASAGYKGIVVLRHWDAAADRWRLVVGYVGEDGIKPDTFYRCDERGKLVEVSP